MGLFDKIKDVVADVAPVVLPVAINAFLPGLGTVASTALGAGIGTLLKGGDAEDALKSAAIGGGIGALSVGMDPNRTIAQDLGTTKGFFSRPLSESAAGPFGTAEMFQTDFAPQQDLIAQNTTPATEAAVRDAINRSNSQVTELVEPSLTGGPFQKGYTDPQLTSSAEFDAMVKKGISPDKALASLQKQYNPSFMDKFGLVGAAGIGALALSEGEEEEESMGPYITGADMYYENPEEYDVDISTFTGPQTVADVLVPSRFEDGGAAVPNKYKGFSKLPEGVQQKIDPDLAKRYKQGGEATFFPRRNGGIGPGEGSGTKDDVPAMLMDGEFVMTRDAVKAAGGGSIEKGIDNMYGLMRNLEARA
jgi:hypothetical protein